MTHDLLAAYERYADQLEDLRRAEDEWAHDEQWMETLVKVSRECGDNVTEQHLRSRLLSARLYRELIARESIAALIFLRRTCNLSVNGDIFRNNWCKCTDHNPQPRKLS